MASQEKERAAIARELHDELGQVLTALRMDSVWMSQRLARQDPQAAQRAHDMCRLIDKNIDDVRSMAIRLRPGVLDDLGLVDALEWYTTDLERRSETLCTFEHQPMPAITDAVATAAYRIAQEALTNVVRHARAAKAVVTLNAENNVLVLQVQDDGQGFDVDALTESEGLGVAGMKERASLVGGQLRVRSTIGQGTQIRLEVPLPDFGRKPA
jgi:signal transduction histidine kinase